MLGENDRRPQTLPALVSVRAVATRDGHPLIAREQRDLLCALAYVALGVGDAGQAIKLLDLVAREMPNDAGVLKLLAYGHVASGNGRRALDILDRLDALDPNADEAGLILLRSQALRLIGDLPRGQVEFRRFVETRRQSGSRLG